MERNTKLLLLIVVGLILLGIGLWILLSPILLPKAQPPQVPATQQTIVTPQTTSTAPRVAPTISPVAANLKRLEDQAASFISRAGSGSSADGFLGYSDVMTGATPAYRATLLSEQAEMKKAHPATGSAFGLITRVVTSSAKNTALDATVTVIVQAQQAEDAGDPSKPTRVMYKEATVTMEKQSNGAYLVDGVTWADAEI